MKNDEQYQLCEHAIAFNDPGSGNTEDNEPQGVKIAKNRDGRFAPAENHFGHVRDRSPDGPDSGTEHLQSHDDGQHVPSDDLDGQRTGDTEQKLEWSGCG